MPIVNRLPSVNGKLAAVCDRSQIAAVERPFFLVFVLVHHVVVLNGARLRDDTGS
jgi:hypothetical protein